MTHFTSKLTMVALGFAMVVGQAAVSEAGGCHGGGGFGGGIGGGFSRPSIYRAPPPAYQAPTCHTKVIQPQLPPPAYDQYGRSMNQAQQGQFPQGQGQFPQSQGQFPQGQGQFPQGQGQFPQGQGQVSQGQSQFPQSQGQFPQGQGQMSQGQGQFPQGQAQAPQGQGQFPQGQGQAQQGQGQVPQGQQGQQAQGQAPQGNGQAPQNSGVAGGNPQSAPAGSQNSPAANSAEMTALELLAGMSSDEGQPQQPQASAAAAAPQAMSSQPGSGRVGTWMAQLPNKVTVRLDLRADGSFVWSAVNNGKSSNFSGTYTDHGGSLTLIRSDNNEQLAGTLTSKANGFNFKVGSDKVGFDFARS